MDTSRYAVSSSIELPESGQPAGSSSASTEVTRAGTRRSFTLAYKRKIVVLASGLPAGEIGALLRREALYSSHLTDWRRLVATLDGQTPEIRRGPKPDLARPERLLNQNLERDNARLRVRLQQADAIIDAQKKLCALLGLPSMEELP
jgi:transposase